MKLNWVISKDKTKALLNTDDLEVLIKKVDLEKDTLEKSKLSNKVISTLGFKKIKTGNNYSNYIDSMNAKLCSKLGDLYEE